MKKIGFLGMGIMGLPIAINLVKKTQQFVMASISSKKKGIFSKKTVEHL